jgi:hypothetical protein
VVSPDGSSKADPPNYATLAPGDACSWLEMAVELLRREWRNGCPAGMAYQTALGSVRRLPSVAASEQVADDLSRVINDLDVYATLPRERRPAALTEISAAIKRLIPEVARLEKPVPSIATFENEPMLVAVQNNRPTQNVLAEPSPSPAAVIAALHRLSPSEFERLVAALLQALGFTNVQVTGGVDDRGVDIIGHDPEGRLVAVQCKRFAPTSTVNALTVQHLVGMAIKRKAHRAMLVTTGSFTGPARTQAEDFDIELIDGLRLASLLGAHPHLVIPLGVGSPSPPVAATPVVPQPPIQTVQPVNSGKRRVSFDGCALVFALGALAAAGTGLWTLVTQPGYTTFALACFGAALWFAWGLWGSRD